MDKQSQKFIELYDLIKLKRKDIYNLRSNLKKEEDELKKMINDMQNSCNHLYVRECTTSGCYAEYHNICKFCDKWN